MLSLWYVPIGVTGIDEGVVYKEVITGFIGT